MRSHSSSLSSGSRYSLNSSSTAVSPRVSNAVSSLHGTPERPLRGLLSAVPSAPAVPSAFRLSRVARYDYRECSPFCSSNKKPRQASGAKCSSSHMISSCFVLIWRLVSVSTFSRKALSYSSDIKYSEFRFKSKSIITSLSFMLVGQ